VSGIATLQGSSKSLVAATVAEFLTMKHWRKGLNLVN